MFLKDGVKYHLVHLAPKTKSEKKKGGLFPNRVKIFMYMSWVCEVMHMLNSMI